LTFLRLADGRAPNCDFVTIFLSVLLAARLCSRAKAVLLFFGSGAAFFFPITLPHWGGHSVYCETAEPLPATAILGTASIASATRATIATRVREVWIKTN